MGVYYQIRDDYSNLENADVGGLRYSCIGAVELKDCSRQFMSQKGFADDLSEGKFSFPVIHGIRADTSNRELISTSRHGHMSPVVQQCSPY